MVRRGPVRDYYEDDFREDDIYEDDERVRKCCRTRTGRRPRAARGDYSSKPTKTTASSTGLRRDTTAFAGKRSSG